MSYKYQIGCGDEMGSEAFQLEHDEQFTNDELTAMIGEAVLDILAKEGKRSGRLSHGFGEYPRNIITWLVDNKGFSKIEYQVNWWVSSRHSIFDKSEWYDVNDNYPDSVNLAAIADIMNAAGYDRTDDGYLLGGDIQSYLFTQNPQTVEEAKQIVIGCFCDEDLSYQDIMDRTTLDLDIIVSVCRKHNEEIKD